MNSWMIYGATGYTGQLIAREAARRGLQPLVAGRNAAAIGRLAEELKLKSRVFSLADGASVSAGLSGVGLVLNCAGPFSQTASTMLAACLAARAHYLDITGEIDVIELAAEKNEAARQAGVTVMPAVGFDVVPSDCLAALLAAELPDATHLQLAFTALGSVSRGTARTILQNLPSGGRVRIDGKIQAVPIGWKTRKIPFPDRARTALTISWGDVASAFHSTGIGNIEVYMSMPKRQLAWLQRLRGLLPLLGMAPIHWLFDQIVSATARGPAVAEREDARSGLWGRVENAAGKSVEATLTTPNAYQLTVLTALGAVEKVLAGGVPVGFQTPSRGLGKEFILSVPTVEFNLGAPAVGHDHG